MKRKKLMALGAIIAVIFTACSNPFFPEKNDFSPERKGKEGILNYTSPTGIELVYVAGGSFQMGQNGNGSTGNVTPVHTVTLSGFYIGRYEVTQAQWYAVTEGITQQQQQSIAGWGSANYGRGDTYPISFVNWYEAIRFCNRLSIIEGLTPAYRIGNSTDPAEWGGAPSANFPNLASPWDDVTIDSGSNGYRLPTEAQWEYAAKGGPLASNPYKIYSGSDDINGVAWNQHNSVPPAPDGSTRPVGTLQANELGIHDMSGNVWEWCWDWYKQNYYNESPTNDPQGPSSGSRLGDGRMARGGDWQSSNRTVERGPSVPYSRDKYGFRLVRPAQ